MRWTSWRWLRLLAGAGILATVVHLWGLRPFVDAVGTIDARLLAVATCIAGVTTLCAAWRWVIVARGLGVMLSLKAAVAACYRSQLLNSVLPGGVVGDVHRGVSHGRVVGDVGRGLRSVWWERSGGQVVQAVLTLAVLVLVPSPLKPSSAAVGSGVVVLALLGVVVHRAASGKSLLAAALRSAVTDVRLGLLASRAWPGVLVTSVVVVAGHVATFVIAARAAGLTAPVTTLLPVALLVLVASGVPTNIAGWGPREGAAGWAFAAAGLGAAAGVRAAVVYGVLALVATMPGAAVLLMDALRRDRVRTTVPVERTTPLEVVVRG